MCHVWGESGVHGASGDRSGASGARRTAVVQSRAAFAAVEQLRAEQNVELRQAVEAEQLAEAERTALLAQTAEGSDRARLQKLLKLERERADTELMALTAEHELALAEKFKRLGVTR